MTEKPMSRIDKQRQYLVDIIEMRLEYFYEFKLNGVSLYDQEIESLKNTLNILKSSKQFKNENHIHQ